MRRAVWMSVLFTAMACGGDAETGSSASGDPFMPSATDVSGTAAQPSSGGTAATEATDSNTVTDSASSTGGASDPTADPTMNPTMNPTMDPTTDPTDPSTDPTLDPTDPPPPADPCDPDMALFEGRPLEASFEADTEAGTCAARRGNTQGATLLFTVRPTGTLDVTAGDGVTMQSSTHGTYVNETAVTNIVTNVEVTIELTDASGEAVSVDFTFSSTGPGLTGVGMRL